MTKIDIFSGFLGAGKTTLIKKLLKEAYVGEKVVLIENEFGEIGIDGGFLQDAGIEITEMNSGCICCSLVGDFGKALCEVLEKFSPDRILIEPSGVGKLSDVVHAVQKVLSDDVVLGCAAAVADASKCRVYAKNFGEFYADQLEHASTIVLSRTGGMSEEKIAAAVALVREKNHEATLITTPWDELDGKKMLAAMESDTLSEALHELEHHHEHCECHHHHHHHADEVFTSVGIETARAFTKDELSRLLDSLDETVLRAKGIVRGEGVWYHFDYVPGEKNIREGSAEVIGRVCVIGAQLDEAKIRELF